MYNDDILNFKSNETNEYVLLNHNHSFNILLSASRNNCISFIKKMTNITDKNKNDFSKFYSVSLSHNNHKISSYLYNDNYNIIYKDIYLKCILNNSFNSLNFLESKKIIINDYNEEYILSECLKNGNYILAKQLIKKYNVKYDNLLYYIYVKKINSKMLIWLLNKIDDKSSIKYINIFNYINTLDFRKLLKITNNCLLTSVYFNKCQKVKKNKICKIMVDNNFIKEDYFYYNNTMKISVI